MSECYPTPSPSSLSDDRESFGYSQSLLNVGSPPYRTVSHTLRGSVRSERGVSTTGSVSFGSTPNSPLPLSRNSFLERLTASSPDRRPQRITSSRTTLRSPILGSNSGLDPSSGQVPLIGRGSGTLLDPVTFSPSPLKLEFKVIHHFEEFEVISQFPLLWNAHVTYFGDLPALGRVAELGMKPLYSHILKVPARNSGMAILVRKMVFYIN